MRMHCDRKIAPIPEANYDVVTNLCTKYRADETEMLPLRLILLGLPPRIILFVNAFIIPCANAAIALLGPEAGIS
jgi:hypothetical protein